MAVEEAFTNLKRLHLSESDLTRGGEIGKGASATVFEGTLVRNGKKSQVAIKRFEVALSALKAEASEALSRELLILAQVDHPNLLHLYGVVPTDPVQIVTELCRGGAVFELLHNKQELEISWRQKLKMCSDTAAGLEYLHGLTPPVLHRDLKSLNLLIVEPFEGRESVDISLKVCDFGLSRLKDEGLMTHGVGTSNWIAPELIGVGAGAYTEKVDTYSYGMIMFEVICREVPYEDILNAGQVIQHVKMGGRPDEEAIPPDCSPSWVELMKECWAEDPSRRPPFTRIRERLAEFERAL